MRPDRGPDPGPNLRRVGAKAAGHRLDGGCGHLGDSASPPGVDHTDNRLSGVVEQDRDAIPYKRHETEVPGLSDHGVARVERGLVIQRTRPPIRHLDPPHMIAVHLSGHREPAHRNFQRTGEASPILLHAPFRITRVEPQVE